MRDVKWTSEQVMISPASQSLVQECSERVSLQAEDMEVWADNRREVGV